MGPSLHSNWPSGIITALSCLFITRCPQTVFSHFSSPFASLPRWHMAQSQPSLGPAASSPPLWTRATPTVLTTYTCGRRQDTRCRCVHCVLCARSGAAGKTQQLLWRRQAPGVACLPACLPVLSPSALLGGSRQLVTPAGVDVCVGSVLLPAACCTCTGSQVAAAACVCHLD